MPSLRRHPKSPYWVACFTLPNGVRTNRSTGTTDKREALRIALEFEGASQVGREGRLTEVRARKTIADIFQMANEENLPRSTAGEFLQSWLKKKEIEMGEKTRIRYGVTVEQFTEFLGNRAKSDIAHISSRDISAFRDNLAKRLSAGTVNTSLKILRAAFNQARRDGLTDTNHAERVDLLKSSPHSPRRPFAPEELQKLIEVADPEWATMIRMGYFTGLRLGDICNLKRANVDLKKSILTLIVEKTNREIEIPVAKDFRPYLERYLQNLPLLSEPLFPTAHSDYEKNYYNGLLSKRFHTLLVKAGLLATWLQNQEEQQM